MNKINLLPVHAKIYGYILLALCLVCLAVIMTNDAELPDDLVSIAMPGFGGGILSKYRFVFEKTGMTHELVFVLTAIALFLIAFAREKDEDELLHDAPAEVVGVGSQDSNGIHHRHLPLSFRRAFSLCFSCQHVFCVCAVPCKVRLRAVEKQEGGKP